MKMWCIDERVVIINENVQIKLRSGVHALDVGDTYLIKMSR